MMNKYQGSAGKILLEETINQLRGLRFLVVQIMDLTESVNEDNFWLSCEARLFKELGLFITCERDAKRIGEEPPDVFGRRAGADALLNDLLRGIQLNVEDAGLLSGKAKEALSRRYGMGHFPGGGALSSGSSAPQQGNTPPDDEWIE